MTIALRCVGIDISKRFLDIFDEATATVERIANAPEAITEQAARWRCAIDARMLATFARAMAPTADPAPSETRQILASLAKRRDQLVHTWAQEKNRRSEAPDEAVVDHIARHIAFLTAEIKATESKIKTIIEAEPELFAQARLLASAPGIGPVACLQLIAQMPELGRIGPRKIAALAGLAPINVDSGAFRGRRTIGSGRKRIRDALYMAALNAVRRDPPSWRILPEAARCRKTCQTGSYRRRPKAAAHRQRHAPQPQSLHRNQRHITVAHLRGDVSRIDGSRIKPAHPAEYAVALFHLTRERLDQRIEFFRLLPLRQMARIVDHLNLAAPQRRHFQ